MEIIYTKKREGREHLKGTDLNLYLFLEVMVALKRAVLVLSV